MKELLRKRLELFIKMRWLKTIDKEVDKHKKLTEKLNRQRCVVNELLSEYFKIYGEDLRKNRESGE